MKRHPLTMALMLALAASGLQAAQKNFDVGYRQTVVEDGRRLHESRRVPHGFRMEIVSDREGIKRENWRGGKPFVTAVKGERYAVRLTNPLPVRVAVNLTVDGLNSIDGKPCGVSDGHKWIIEPYSTVTIPGWQVSGNDARRFFFTDKPKSYAKWQGDRMGRDLSANCGVIGAAFFWSQKDLDRYYEEHPVYRDSERPLPYSSRRSKAAGLASAPSCAERETLDACEKGGNEKAGTGMGERESHPTVQVRFHYDRGMYKVDQALVVYYDFEKKHEPNPFPELGYAPEMP